VRTIADQFDVNVVVDTGDIVDWGTEAEASYVGAISTLRVPYLYVRGNHDSVATAAAVARQPNAKVLDDSTVTVAGLTFAGIGDPRFTPDKTAQTPTEAVVDSGRRLADKIRSLSPKPVDVAMVHDPAAAGPLAGTCPVVLAGHLHSRRIERLEPTDGSDGRSTDRTLLMVQGSTGGAGLRGLEGKTPMPLALSILYFDKSRVLQAYDDIRVGGTGLTEVSLERHLVPPDVVSSASPSEAGSPS
jgi:predicted phosphodiesterase